jgi:hypothetical protein
MTRWIAAWGVALALLTAACGGPFDGSSLPAPSARHAYSLSHSACRDAVREFGLAGFARKVHADGRRPTDAARAAVRYAAPYVREQRPGYLKYRRAAYRGCLAGIRSALASGAL